MTETSKFENFYILRIIFIPIICVGMSLLLLDVKINYKRNIDITSPVLFCLIIGGLVLLYNLNSLYKIIVEETKITKIYFLSRKTEIISYSIIKSLDKEFINGGNIAKVGRISNGYNNYAFSLINGKKLIVSPLYFENYNQLIMAIIHNQNNQSD